MQIIEHPTSETHETYTYCGITAPVALWASVGLIAQNWAEGTTKFPHRLDPAFGQRGATDGELIEARITTGDTGEKALVWLIAERRRQREETARNNAAQVSAEAQKKAGDAAIHAARIHRQAEELRCLAAGISEQAINSRLE